MIGRISGKLNYISADHILVDVSGVGYILYVTQTTLANLPKLGNTVSLFTELVVKEDLLQLVGFITTTEKEWYKLLTSVQGVGSKAALALLSQLSISTLSRAILLEDSTTITSAQGVGPKIAKRLVVELKGKVPSMMKFNYKHDLSSNHLNSQIGNSSNKINIKSLDQDFSKNDISQKELDAISALINLGYSQLDASQVIAKIINSSEDELNVEEIIRLSLKTLVSKG